MSGVRIWDERTHRGLAINVAAAIAIACLANAFAFWANPAEMSSSGSVYDLPGYVIGMVWVALFTGLGISRWLLLGHRNHDMAAAPDWVFALVLFCAAYPIYTMGLRSLTIGLAGNVATGVFALWIAKRILSRSPLAAGLVACVTGWVAFASWLTVLQMKGALS